MPITELQGVELKSCPFCGSGASAKGDGVHFWVRCDNEQCGVSTKAIRADQRKAIDSWNARA